MADLTGTRPIPPSADKRAGSRHALSLPNLLTYGRIIAVPALVICLFIDDKPARWAALVVFILAGVSDFFDGYLARAWQQQSAIGRMLDPIADKLLVAAALLMLVANRMIYDWHVFAAVVILTREVLVTGLREFLAEIRVSVPVTQLAKWKTTIQMVAIGVLLAASPGGVLAIIGLGLLWVSALITLYTGYDYARSGIRHLLAEEK
jgi:cardiolipin synthase